MNWDILKRILVSLWQTSFGQNGNNNFISNTAATAGNWTALQVLSATARIASITIDGNVDSTSLASTDINQGVIIYGKITSVQLTNGIVRMYGGSNANL
jgi:hypothetical protein